jgi:hypothetical protein
MNDITGKVIYSKKSNQRDIEIDVENNNSGIYFVKVVSEINRSIFKIVKE